MNRNGAPRAEVRGETFEDEEVKLDNRRFVDCEFRRCKLVFEGSAPFQFKDNRISECSWRFAGYAGLTIGMLAQMHAGGLEEHVEDLFQKIREKGSD